MSSKCPQPLSHGKTSYSSSNNNRGNVTISQLLKKLETGEEVATEKPKERGEAVGAGDEKQEDRLVASQPETAGER